ncbi:MAG: PD40 domain-containing protein [Pirellulales bacterium]|nr:PD40 domain-containing protein [Pirellulales bacterium]
MTRTTRFPAPGTALVAGIAGVLLACHAIAAGAEPTPRQAAYWWQDEIRSLAFALGKARTGQVAQWPGMTVPAGSATVPLPLATGPITADGRLDEQAWQCATRLPVGPIFDAWGAGPLMLQLSACRDQQHVYLAVESPRDLAGLGALTPAGELWTIGQQAFHGRGKVVELALPYEGELTLSFAVEALRRIDGKLPPGAADLGLDRLAAGNIGRGRSPLWLAPISVRLVPSEAAVRLTIRSPSTEQIELATEVIEKGKTPTVGTIKLTQAEDPSVYAYAWQTQAEGKTFAAEGFFYVESVAAELFAARQIAQRSAALGSTGRAAAPLPEALAALEAEAKRTSPQDRDAWRALYCRARAARARAHRSMLDAPLLLTQRHPYFAGHIYDDYYTWHPGGGVYLLDEPSDPGPDAKLRPLIDPTTNETLGGGVYRDPDVSWDADRVLFAYKPDAAATTSLYEIGIDGRGLRRLTASEKHHDITPAYLPDGRIVFTSTRPRALVPCFNSGVDTLHVMNADGSDIHSISYNNVTEFDPAVMPDGRILYGRWEYVDKTALYMQSLWTISPDGRMEEALFANNLARPTALLDARPVPGSARVVASLTPHNGQAVGAIATIDARQGKNNLDPVVNFTPEYPVRMDQGLQVGPCDPWPLSEDDVLLSNNAIADHGIIELADRFGHRELLWADPRISCFAPMLVRPRAKPAVVSPRTTENQPGAFLVVDVYQGLEGVERGTIKRLRVVEETARTSGIPPGGRWWNQAFLISWQGAYIVKNFLGTVPVHEDGSAYFEVPPGRAVYFEALDAEGREIQRMRTFVQAAAGATRSCIGCHENKLAAPLRPGALPLAMLQRPARPEPESWGSGYIDYPTHVQPVLDKYCVRCHGGKEGIGKGLDYSGGWTWAFNIGYETLIKHRLVGFLNCNNASVHTSELLQPRGIGSGAAPLAEVLIQRHPEMARHERDLVLAWMDTNSNYYGTWDYTPHATCDAILATRGPLAVAMQAAGCTECHAAGHIGNDWVNLQTPEFSRILRAPMAKSDGGLGVGFCRKRKARSGYPLVDQSVQPPDVLYESRQPPWDAGGEEHVVFASTDDPHYQQMLAIIRQARGEALARPRVDMPGAEVVPGECRLQVPMPVPDSPPKLAAAVRPDGAVELRWQRTAEVIGLQFELHRAAQPDFTPGDATRIGLTTAGRFVDPLAPEGTQHYALVVTSGTRRSRPVFAPLEVPTMPPPAAPLNLDARPLSGEVALTWDGVEAAGLRYDVFRHGPGDVEQVRLNAEPLRSLHYADPDAQPGTTYSYAVGAVDRRGRRGPLSETVEAAALPEIREPVFVARFQQPPAAELREGRSAAGRLHAGAAVAGGALQLGAAGFATFEHLPEYDLGRAISVACWVRIDRESTMPVILSCGAFNQTGWFLQRFAGGWRWHLGGVSCDGGSPAVGRWVHLVGTFNGRRACLYQDGKPVAEVDAQPNPAPWPGPLVVGQYSSQSPQYQVSGRIGGATIHRRALKPAEVAAEFDKGPPPPTEP